MKKELYLGLDVHKDCIITAGDVARQLAVDLWRIKTGRLTAEQLGLTI
jgi:hypothetical protein